MPCTRSAQGALISHLESKFEGVQPRLTINKKENHNPARKKTCPTVCASIPSTPDKKSFAGKTSRAVFPNVVIEREVKPGTPTAMTKVGIMDAGARPYTILRVIQTDSLRRPMKKPTPGKFRISSTSRNDQAPQWEGEGHCPSLGKVI